MLISHFLKTLTVNTLKNRAPRPKTLTLTLTMSINLQSHAFAGNPLRSESPAASLETLKTLLLVGTQEGSSPSFKVLPFRKGRPLARSTDSATDSPPSWHLGWVSPANFKEFPVDSFFYLGSQEGEEYWAVDVGEGSGVELGRGGDGFCFVELRTLMVATDWADARAMGELAIAGHARALLEWHNVSRFCGLCGSQTAPIDAGRRKQCINESCRKRIYPRVDPVVIMLVIDKENDRCLLSRQSRFVPRMWSCLAGFIEGKA